MTKHNRKQHKQMRRPKRDRTIKWLTWTILKRESVARLDASVSGNNVANRRPALNKGQSKFAFM